MKANKVNLQSFSNPGEVKIGWWLKTKVYLANHFAMLYRSLFSKSFTNIDSLISYLAASNNKDILLVVPAIWVGGSDLSDQFSDYLDASAALWKELTRKNYSFKIFLLGANHKNEGFLHLKGKKYLQKKFSIPDRYFLANDSFFFKLGLSSVEETELLKKFFDENRSFKNYFLITITSKSQFTRYFLIQKGYSITSHYFVLPDKPTYFHSENENFEKYLIALSVKDPRWEGRLGQVVRGLTRDLRDPDSTKKIDVKKAVESLRKNI